MPNFLEQNPPSDSIMRLYLQRARARISGKIAAGYHGLRDCSRIISDSCSPSTSACQTHNLDDNACNAYRIPSYHWPNFVEDFLHAVADQPHPQMARTAWRRRETPWEPATSQEFQYLSPSVAKTVVTSKCSVIKVKIECTPPNQHTWLRQKTWKAKMLLNVFK